MGEPEQASALDWAAVAAAFPAGAHTQSIGGGRETGTLQQNEIARAGVACIPTRWKDENGLGQETLLIQRARSHSAGSWSVPGGWIDFGETAHDAAIRELWEEVGLRPVAGTLEFCGLTEDLFSEAGKHCITLWYRCMVHTGIAPTVAPEEVADYRWVPRLERWSRDLPSPLFLPLRNYLSGDS